MTAPRVADTITLTRAPGDPTVRVVIDGETFPWTVEATDGVVPVLAPGRPPGVTLTVMARSVVVDDQYLVGADLVHDCDDDEDASGP